MKKHAVRHLIEAVYGTPWAILPGKLDEIAELLNLRAAGEEFTEDQIRERIAPGPTLRDRVRADLLALDLLDEPDDEPGPAYLLTRGGTALVPLEGVLAPKMNLVMRMSGGTSTQLFAASVRAAAGNEKVKAIVAVIDSPGGSAVGLEEAADALRAAAKLKPTKALTYAMMASAAYYIGAAADEVIAAPDAMVGSIGTILIHRETSKADDKAGATYTVFSAGKFKAAANSHQPLSKEGRDALQELVDDYHDQFVASVAASRGIPAERVRTEYGQGKVLIASKAKTAGLVDRLGTLADLVRELETTATPSSTMGAPKMDKIRQKLQALGLIQADADDATVEAVLASWFAARGQTPPSGDDREKLILAALGEKPPAASAPPAPAPAPPVATPPAAPPATPATPPAASGDAALAERERIREIQTRGQLLAVPDATIQAAVDAGTSLDDFLRDATAARAGAEPPVARIEPGAAESDTFGEAAAAVIALRVGAGTEADLPAAARDLRHSTLMDVARESLRLHDRRHVGSPEEIASTALEGDGRPIILGAAYDSMNTPGMFPNILSAAARKILAASDPYAGTTYQNWAYKMPTVPDFKPQTIIRLGEFGELPLHIDGDPFEQSSFEEGYAWIAVDSYGDEFALTPRMIVDDNLGAFQEALTDKPAAHAATLNRLCVNLLIGNVTCADGTALYHSATRGNDRTSGGAPSTSELSEIRKLMRAMTGLSAKRKLNYNVDRILVPPALETTTQQLLQSTLQILPVTTATTEPFRGQVRYDIEPMLADDSDVKWYSFATPGRAIAYCHQTGYESVRVRVYFDPRTNCRVHQFEGRFAAAVRNPKGTVRNAGA